MASVAELTNDRTRALVDAGIALASELSLDAVLQKLVDTAAELTGARYAALGVIDLAGRGLERFITTGVDEETIERIGNLPRGLGILGLIIRDARPLRLHDLREDPHSVGFPPNHPPMTTFLGMPVLLRGVAYGNLYLTEKEGGVDFTAEDEEITGLLAAQAAVAIENARLYESATRWLAQLESLNEIGNSLVAEVGLSRQLQLVAQRLRTLLGARIVTVNLPNPDGSLKIVAADGEQADELLGATVAAHSKSAAVLASRHGQRVDSLLDDPDVDQVAARLLGARTGLYVPLVAHDRAIGVIDAHDKLGDDLRFTDDDMRLAESFASRASVAVDLSERVARESLRGVVEAQELERRRLARELHDETGQALTSILLGLRAMEAAKTDEASGREAARGRASPQGARRLRPDRGTRAARGDVDGADENPRRAGGETARAPAVGDRDGALPHRPGGADEYREARARLAREHCPLGKGACGDCGDRGRRDRLCPAEHAGGRSRARRDARARRARRRPARDRVARGGGHDTARRGAGAVITVLIADDHAVVRSGLRLLLESQDDIEVVEEAGSADEAVRHARLHKPDVVLLDVVMPGRSGIEAVPDILQAAKGAKVLVLSMQDDPRYVREAFAAGASGYVLKEAADVEVVAAVREVAAGGRYVHPALGARLVAAEAEAASRTADDPLSEREREVLRLLALGHTNQEIAKMLFISVRTAETHRAHIMQKLGLSSRAELVRYALAQGLLVEGEEEEG